MNIFKIAYYLLKDGNLRSRVEREVESFIVINNTGRQIKKQMRQVRRERETSQRCKYWWEKSGFEDVNYTSDLEKDAEELANKCVERSNKELEMERRLAKVEIDNQIGELLGKDYKDKS